MADETVADETVLLTGYCKRKQHVMFRVLDTPGGLVIDAPLYCAGRERETWTPMRRKLTGGSASRYGCPCRRTDLIGDDQMLDRIRRGERQMLIDAYNISRR